MEPKNRLIIHRYQRAPKKSDIGKKDHFQTIKNMKKTIFTTINVYICRFHDLQDIAYQMMFPAL